MGGRNLSRDLAAKVAALRQAMEVVMQGTTPDHAKWTGVNSFARTYCELATQYTAVTGDKSVKVYDTKSLKDPFDTLWPAQKGLFDTIYLDTLTLHNLLERTEKAPQGPIYNLLVSGFEDAWRGEPFELEESRCVREYTSQNLTDRYGTFDKDSISHLKRAPSIFAFETGLKLQPKFGYVRGVSRAQKQVRIEYEILDVKPFLSFDDLQNMRFELNIEKLELYRTHWAVKEVDLPKELHGRGIVLPSSMQDIGNAVDVSKHVFDVALSFPGEIRSLVEEIAQELERRLGPNTYFYDNNYVSQLAQPSLDSLLQGIYRRAKLDVVFLGADYQRKNWCGVEFRAVKDIIFSRENTRVMFVRTDDGSVDGVSATDGFVDARRFPPAKIAEFICERVDLLRSA